MEQYIRENKSYFLKQAASYKFPPNTQKEAQDLLSDTVIATRIRPLLPHEKDLGEVVGVSHSERSSVVHELRQKVNGQPALNSTVYNVDKIYGPDEGSAAIYKDLVEPLLPWAWSGGISTFFAYGQTGSGKTHSVSQLEELVAAGLLSGTLEGNRDVYICVFELVGNLAFDLLNDRKRISVMEDSFGESQLVGAVEHKSSTPAELLELIERSMSFRKTAATLKNDTSSRSHAVCRIRIANKDVPEAPDGLLFLIDLAGSELGTDSKKHSQERMKETREINVSLSTLKDCIRGRALWNISEIVGTSAKRATKAHIPFRSSVLTKVLKHVFDVKGERFCKTAVLACVKPTASDAAASKNTLRYAELLRVPMPHGKARAYNPKVPSTWTNKQLKEWVKNNSGDPHVSASELAPTETGSQLIKIPKAEFVIRCLKTEAVTPEQARVFHDKLWRLHVDSRSAKTDDTSNNETLAVRIVPKEPFQTRLRPGMVVQLKQPHPLYPARRVALLCPEGAFDGNLGDSKKYICAEVNPGFIADSYTIALEYQNMVSIDDMEREVLLEFDPATRYYFVNV